MKEILIISNDDIFLNKKKIASNYNDTINIIEAVGQSYNIFLFSKISKSKKNFSIKLKNKIINISMKFFLNIKKKNLKVLMISITPRNLLYYIIARLFIKNINGYIYLRSNGHKEYSKKIGFIGYLIYDLMQKFLEKNLKTISVSNNIYSSKNTFFLKPSELNNRWFKKTKKINFSTPKLLYFGRFKKEKGVYSLIDLLSKLKFRATIAGTSKSYHLQNRNIKFINEISDPEKIIKLYDSHNIFILPSFTEGSPKVILESLARKRPVIVFNEIKHVKVNYKGIFVCQRNTTSLKKKIIFIMKNYKKIQTEMSKNKLPTKKQFQDKLINILNAKTTN